MRTLKVSIPKKEVQKFISYVIGLGGEIVSSESPKEELRQKTLQELEEGLNEAFDIIKGKTERKPLMQALRGQFCSTYAVISTKRKGI